jgi:ATP-binding cassette subfamily C protein EexD
MKIDLPPSSLQAAEVTSVKAALLRCRESFVAVGVFSGAVNLLMLVPAFYMLNVYDKAVGHNSVQTLVMLSVITLLLFIAMGALEITRTQVLVHIARKLHDLLSPALHRVSFENAVLVGPANASPQPLTDLNGFRTFLSGPGLIAILDAPWVPIYLTVLFIFHPLLGWMGVAACFIFFGLALANQRMTQSAIVEANNVNRISAVSMAQELRNAEVTSAMGMLESLRARWQRAQDLLITAQSEASGTRGFFSGTIKTLRLAVQSAAIGAGALLVIQQEISPGMIIAGSILIGRALQPIEVAVGAWSGYADAKEQYLRINVFLDKFKPPPPRMQLPPIKGRISATAATITPPGSQTPSVKRAEFECAPGTVFLLMGPSGAGKSSLIKGILGLWPTSGGEIRLDGAEASSFARDELGPQIGYLPQDIELFQGTVKDNIARFGPAESEDVILAARDAGVHDFILSLPQGYDTDIGLAGAALSPGQRQRIALARALFGRPKLVVLDEPNSNLDEAGELALNAAIETLKTTDSTVIIVSHRQSVLPIIDYVLLLNDGLIQDAGPKAEVFERLRAKTNPVPALPPKPKKSPVQTVTWKP